MRPCFPLFAPFSCLKLPILFPGPSLFFMLKASMCLQGAGRRGGGGPWHELCFPSWLMSVRQQWPSGGWVAQWSRGEPAPISRSSSPSLLSPPGSPQHQGLGSWKQLFHCFPPLAFVCKGTPTSGLHRHRTRGDGGDIPQPGLKDSPCSGP